MLMVAAVGCSSPPAAAVPAVVVVENHTDCTWRVAFSRDDDPGFAKAAWEIVGPRKTRRMEMPGGEYRVGRRLVDDQTVDGPDGESIRMSLKAGHAYVWPLATLFSSETDLP